MTAEEWAEWQSGGSNAWRERVGDDLLGGYAHLDSPTAARIAEVHAEDRTNQPFS